MRLRALLSILLIVLAVAGCTSDVPPEPTPETTTPTATTEPTPTTVEPAEPTPTTPEPTPEPERGPQTLLDETHDFQGEPAATPETTTFDVAPGFDTLNASVAFTSTGPSGIGNTVNVNVRILDASGGEVLACTKETCRAEVPTPGAGEWVVEYSGAGTTEARVVVIAS